MQIKSELRRELKNKRKNIKNKSDIDRIICGNLMRFDEYKKADLILFYAALDDEINIDACIENALSLDKKVGLPVCLDNNGNMNFYYISSLSDIKSGFFGVREPDTKKCTQITDFSKALCVVPAIAYDKLGYRLGYGKGYYDRFLQNFSSISVGLCYNELVNEKLPIGEYDIPVDYIITQNGLIAFK